MRDTKFRVWDKKNKKMLYYDKDVVPSLTLNGVLVEHVIGVVNEIPDVFEHNVSNEYELMQYTGLKDKNGKEIYEGDILIWKEAMSGRKDRRYTVKWDYLDLSSLKIGEEMELLEICGNIYEN